MAYGKFQFKSQCGPKNEKKKPIKKEMFRLVLICSNPKGLSMKRKKRCMLVHLSTGHA